MTANEQTGPAPVETESIEDQIIRFVTLKTRSSPAVDQDLFATGLATSMFAMELVVFLEQTFAIAILGRDLQLVNFRTVEAMANLVRRLCDDTADSGL